ncbi:MAG: collagen-binding domain-containing protein [Rubrivivax sp.]|jgi:choice-of-anchor A domain-containing protein
MKLRSNFLRSWACTLALFGAGASQAAALTAIEVLQQFNLVTLGDATTSSHVDGRAFIGGHLHGQNAVIGMHPNDTPASAYSALTVIGNVNTTQVTAGGMTTLGNVNGVIVNNGATAIAGNASNSNFNGSGGVYVGGTKNGVNSNSGSLSASTAAAMFATATSTDFSSVLNGASDSLKALSTTGSHWTVSGNRVTFHAIANAQGVAVFDLAGAGNLLAYGEFDFDLGSATSVIFNSDVTSATINANVVGAGAQAVGNKMVWNFYNATYLNMVTQFAGSILATDALLTNSNNIEGGVFVNTLVQNGEIHLGAYTGVLPTPPGQQVPEPGTLGLLAAAAAAAAWTRRRSARA